MDNISTEFQEIINKNLPHAVGNELQKVLTKAQEDAKRVEFFLEENQKLKEEIKALKVKEIEFNSAKEKERQAEERLREYNNKLEILKIKEEHAKERVQEIKSLTERVFSSNRMNYNLNLNGSSYTPHGSFSVNMSGEVDGEK